MQRCAKDYCFILEHIQSAVVVVITVFFFCIAEICVVGFWKISSKYFTRPSSRRDDILSCCAQINIWWHSTFSHLCDLGKIKTSEPQQPYISRGVEKCFSPPPHTNAVQIQGHFSINNWSANHRWIHHWAKKPVVYGFSNHSSHWLRRCHHTTYVLFYSVITIHAMSNMESLAGKWSGQGALIPLR